MTEGPMKIDYDYEHEHEWPVHSEVHWDWKRSRP